MAAQVKQTDYILDEETKVLARDMYISMGMCRLGPICEKYQIPRKVLDEVKEREDWIGLRAKLREDNAKALIAELGDPSTVPSRVIKVGQSLLGKLEKRAETACNTTECADLAKVLERVYELLTRAYKEVGLVK